MGASDSLDSTNGLRSRLGTAALRRVWPLAAAILVIAVIGAGLTFTKQGRPAVLSAFLLPDMMVELPLRPVTWFTDDPIVEREFIDYGSGRILADIYRPPDDKRHAALLLSMGAPPLDLDDSRLVKLGEDMARAGIVMVIPFSNRLDAEIIEPAEIDRLVGVFEHVEKQPYVDPERVGFVGVSIGGSLALLAAADARIAERVNYVVSFGGYFNALDTLVAVGSGRIAYDGEVEEWEPDPHTVRVMAEQLIDELSGRDARLLTRVFVRGEQVSAEELAQLSDQGRASYELMTNGDPERTQELLDELPPAAIERLERLSPSGVIDRLQAEIFILHDQGDAFIPYVESRRLRDALDGREDVHFTEVSLFEHVEPRLGRGGDVLVLDGTRLYFRLYQLLLKLS